MTRRTGKRNFQGQKRQSARKKRQLNQHRKRKSQAFHQKRKKTLKKRQTLLWKNSWSALKMLDTKPMARVRIFASRNNERKIIEALQDASALHIKSFERNTEGFFDIGQPLEDNGKISGALVNARALMSALGIEPLGSGSPEGKVDYERLEKARSEFSRLGTALEAARADIRDCEKELGNPLHGISLPEGAGQEFSSISMLTGTTQNDPGAELEKELNGRCWLKVLPNKGAYSTVIFTKKEDSELAKKILSKSGFREFPLPERNPAEIRAVLKNSTEKEKAILWGISAFKKQNVKFLLETERLLAMEAEKTEAPLKFAASKNAFAVEGFVPLSAMEEFRTGMEKEFRES